MKQIIQTFAEQACAPRGTHGVAKRHLLERKDHAMTRALLDAHCPRGDFRELLIAQESPELSSREGFLPVKMSFPFVFSFELDVISVAKAVREQLQEFPPAGASSG